MDVMTSHHFESEAEFEAFEVWCAEHDAEGTEADLRSFRAEVEDMAQQSAEARGEALRDRDW